MFISFFRLFVVQVGFDFLVNDFKLELIDADTSVRVASSTRRPVKLLTCFLLLLLLLLLLLKNTYISTNI